MALVNKAFSVSVTPGMMPPVIHVSEYDIGRAYTVSIIDEQGNQFVIPTGTTASIEGTLNGKVGFTQSATVSNNQVSFTLSESMTAYSGKAWCKIKLVQNSQPIQTCAFVLAVDRAGVEADTVIGAPGFEEQIADAAAEWMEQQGFTSPTVSITPITGGNRVTFTDAEHPQGQSIDVMDGEDGGGFELPEGGEAGQALISDGEGGAEWGNVSPGEGDLDVYGFTDDDYTAVDITDQFTAAEYPWNKSTNNNNSTTLSPVIPVPQKIVIKNNRSDLDLKLRYARFLNGQDPATATVATLDTETAGSERWQSDIAKETERIIYTHEFGRAGFEYMQMRWTGGTFASWAGHFQVIAYYTNKRPTYENELNQNDGFEHDVDVQFGGAVATDTWGNATGSTACLIAVVPFYPNRKYTIKGGYWVNAASTNIFSWLLYDDSLINNYYPNFRPQSGTIAPQPPLRLTSATVVQSGASNNGHGILEYICGDPTQTHDYPKYVAFAMYSATKPAVADASVTYPYTDETIATWMAAAKTALDNKAPWGYVTAFDELIDRKASECADFVNPYAYYNDAGSHHAALLSPACPMTGATLTVFGDSISDNYGGHDLTGSGFLSKICREFGMKLDNRAKAGSNMYVATDSYANVCGINMLNAYLDELEAETIEQSGYILIEFGTNAYSNQIGTNTDTSANTNTQYGAVKYFIEQLRTHSPNSVFGFILPHDVDWGNNTGKQQGVPLARAAIKAVCEEYRVPYFDMYNDSGLTASMLSDGVHIGSPQSANLYYHAVRRFVMGL